MANFTGPPASATRNQPISPELQEVLQKAADAAGVGTVRITSGGQPARGEGTRRTGSTRHDRGRAADLQLVVDGSTASFTNSDAQGVVKAFVTAAAAHGATGIGAAVDYMGPRTIHVGFGTSVDDLTKLTWGAGGRSANASQWLREAAAAGWASPAPAGAVPSTPGRYTVIAREGLRLRGGPGTSFGSMRTLAAGTDLEVVGYDGTGGAWARVDLEGDGQLDGYVFAAYLGRASAASASSESVEEPEGVSV